MNYLKFWQCTKKPLTVSVTEIAEIIPIMLIIRLRYQDSCLYDKSHISLLSLPSLRGISPVPAEFSGKTKKKEDVKM